MSITEKRQKMRHNRKQIYSRLFSENKRTLLKQERKNKGQKDNEDFEILHSENMMQFTHENLNL